MPADIFISYSRSDKEFALALARAIENTGKSVWWDDQIPAGSDFRDNLDATLKSVKAIVVIWSRDSVQSRWVKEEAEEGAARGILVPVLRHDVEVPRGFRGFQTVDLTDWDGESETPTIQQLTSRLGSTNPSQAYHHSARSAADLVHRRNAIRNTGMMIFACAMFFIYAGWDFFEQDSGAYINRVRLGVIGVISLMAAATWFLRGPRRTSWVMCFSVVVICYAALLMNYHYHHPEIGLAKSNTPLNVAIILVWGLCFGVISAMPSAVAVLLAILGYAIAMVIATEASAILISSNVINLLVLGTGLVCSKLWR